MLNFVYTLQAIVIFLTGIGFIDFSEIRVVFC